MKITNRIWPIIATVSDFLNCISASKSTSHVEEAPQNVVNSVNNYDPQTLIATNANSIILPSISASSPYVNTPESIKVIGTQWWSAINTFQQVYLPEMKQYKPLRDELGIGLTNIVIHYNRYEKRLKFSIHFLKLLMRPKC